MSRTNGEQRAMDSYEDSILAQLAGIPTAAEIIRVKVEHTMIRFPETVKILHSALDELDDIAIRAATIKQAAGQYHRLRWGNTKGESDGHQNTG